MKTKRKIEPETIINQKFLTSFFDNWGDNLSLVYFGLHHPLDNQIKISSTELVNTKGVVLKHGSSEKILTYSWDYCDLDDFNWHKYWYRIFVRQWSYSDMKFVAYRIANESELPGEVHFFTPPRLYWELELKSRYRLKHEK